MIDGAPTFASGIAGSPALFAPRVRVPMSGLRFFLTAYAGGLAFFLAILA